MRTTEATLAETYARAIAVLDERGWCRLQRESGHGHVCLAGALALALELDVHTPWDHPELKRALAGLLPYVPGAHHASDVIDFNDAVTGYASTEGRETVKRVLTAAITTYGGRKDA